MAEPLDIVSKQLSSSIEFKRGMAALLASSADSEQRALDACNAMKAERDEYKNRCEELERQLAEAKAMIAQLTHKPIVKVTVKGKAKVNRLVTGDVHEIYAKDDSNTRQQHKRISAG